MYPHEKCTDITLQTMLNNSVVRFYDNFGLMLAQRKLSNRRAVSVCRLSSVTYTLWLNYTSYQILNKKPFI